MACDDDWLSVSIFQKNIGRAKSNEQRLLPLFITKDTTGQTREEEKECPYEQIYNVLGKSPLQGTHTIKAF